MLSCIISLLPKCLSRRSAGRAQLIYSRERVSCLSLKQYERSFSSCETSRPLNMGRSPHFEVCVRVRVHVQSLGECPHYGAATQKSVCDDLILSLSLSARLSRC